MQLGQNPNLWSWRKNNIFLYLINCLNWFCSQIWKILLRTGKQFSALKKKKKINLFVNKETNCLLGLFWSFTLIYSEDAQSAFWLSSSWQIKCLSGQVFSKLAIFFSRKNNYYTFCAVYFHVGIAEQLYRFLRFC